MQECKVPVTLSISVETQIYGEVFTLVGMCGVGGYHMTLSCADRILQEVKWSFWYFFMHTEGLRLVSVALWPSESLSHKAGSGGSHPFKGATIINKPVRFKGQGAAKR